MAIAAPFLPYERLRQIADEFIARYHPSRVIPVPIERIIDFDFEFDIVPVPGLLDKFDVDAFITSDLTEIRVDRYSKNIDPIAIGLAWPTNWPMYFFTRRCFRN